MKTVRIAAALLAVIAASGCAAGTPTAASSGDGRLLPATATPTASATGTSGPTAQAPDPATGGTTSPGASTGATSAPEAALPCYQAQASDGGSAPYPGLSIKLDVPQTAGVSGAFLSGTLTVTNSNKFPVTYFEQAPRFSPNGVGGTGSAVEVLAPGSQQVVGGTPLRATLEGTENEVQLAPGATRTVPVTVPLLSCASATSGYALAPGTYDLRVGIFTSSSLVANAPFHWWYAPRTQITVS